MDFIYSSISNRKFCSINVCLCTCLLITNWVCLGLIYLLPKLNQSCLIQSYFLHVFIYFHFYLIICLHLYWSYCFTFEESSQQLTYRQIIFFLLFIFIFLCILTLPSSSHVWASIIFDKILQICIVDYTFNYSYTFFILTIACLIPFILLCISHQQQMKIIQNQIWKFQISFLLILLWSFLNILFSIILHIPIKYSRIRFILFYIQIISFIFEPIFLYIYFSFLS